MIKTLKLQLLATLFLGTLTLASCRDECKDVDCGANGTCVEGTCVCNEGYLGGSCETAWNAKYKGTFSCDVTCNSGTFPHDDVALAPKSGATKQFYITGLYFQGGQSVVADVLSSGTSFKIDKQPLGNSAYEIESTSVVLSTDGKQITLGYRTYQMDTVVLEDCTALLAFVR
jgi:hypothetical protein